MSYATLEAEIQEQLMQLSLEQQRQVLEFARALVTARVHGVPGQTLLRFVGLIEADDLATMQHQLTLATRDEHFQAVEGLAVEQW